jgi:DNA-binding SARP family transcriptional activator/predicted ATPase
MMPRLNACFFGYPVIEIDGAPVKIDRRKTLALLAYLLVNGELAIHGRESLATLFWPEMGQAEAGASLRHALWELNHELGEGWIDKEGQAIRIHLEKNGRVDVLEFRALSDKGKQLSQTDSYRHIHLLLEAVALYRGDFLAGFTLRDSPEFDRWQNETGERLRDQFAGILSSLAQAYGQAGEHDAAIVCARRWLALDPLNEAAHRALMQRYDAADQRLSALRQYDECVRILKKELGVIPEPATRAVYEKILSRKSAPAPVSGRLTPVTEIKPAGPPVQAALPPVATRFVGRENELQKVTGLLAKPECRLVSVIGPGGIGKTRIAIQIVQQLRGDPIQEKETAPSRSAYPDGIYFISLSDASSVAVMLKRIANALGCPFREEMATLAGFADNRLRLMHFLTAKKCLLVLDNLEQLAEISTVIGDLLAAAPALKILATSRHRLNLSQEWLVELSGMPVPGYRDKVDFQEYSSVRLFMENASRASSAFTPDPQEMAAIGRICQLVDGMPLGIELAAAWVRTFTCQEIATEIENNLDFLYSSTQGIPERHQSLRAAFEYSWRLLPEHERSVLRRLSVFRGGFSREIAARVAGATLPLLTSLIDRCLLRKTPNGRYGIHEVLKQYAREKLAAEAREEKEALDFHSETYLDFLIDMGEQLKSAGLAHALLAIDAELENFQAAWDRAVDFQRIEHLLQAMPHLILYYETANHWARGREVFTRTLEKYADRVNPWLERLRGAGTAGARLTPAEEAELAFLTLLKAAWKHFAQLGRIPPEAIEKSDREALEMVHYLPDRQEKAYSLILINSGPQRLPAEQVLDLLQLCVRIGEQEQDLWGQALSWMILGDFHSLALNDNLLGRKAYHTSLGRFLALGNEWGKAVCYNGLGIIAFREGNWAEARSLWSECIAVFQQLNNVWRGLDSRFHLAEACEKDGDLEGAIGNYRTNADILQGLGEKWSQAWNLYHAARLEFRCGLAGLARQHHAMAMELFHQVGDLESAGKIAVLFDTGS